MATPTSSPSRPGQWVRWQINYRFTSSWGGDRYYLLETLNLLNGSISQTDLFLAQSPVKVKSRQTP
jgi:hypothetical protein